ncbi:unnamed protein product [Effrenium voratum]|uniref:Uncharacterized protein n=1 Tax=Effrenium voratum TaxID=2562239 RepID=A0AA36IL91_9DINO|nr:unnamed protein product [Effrenium voratum]CAJ1389426.1 unnamed protein product [Effrenium voratum]CAJ1447142.1 unnamed protein product [Effrenium voratum]
MSRSKRARKALQTKQALRQETPAADAADAEHVLEPPELVAGVEKGEGTAAEPAKELGFGVMDTWLGDVGTCSARCGRWSSQPPLPDGSGNAE